MPGLAGGGLPDAEQIITADASGYLAALDQIIGKNQDWISKTREMQGEADKWQRTLDQFMRNMPQIGVKVDTDQGFEQRVREMQAITDRLADTALKANEKMAQAWDSHAESVHEVAQSYEHAGDALGDLRQHVQDGGSQVRSLSQDMAELGRNAERTAAAIERVTSSGWTPEKLAAAARANADQSAGASFGPARYYSGPGGGGSSDEAQLRTLDALRNSRIIPDAIKDWLSRAAYGVPADTAARYLQSDIRDRRLFGGRYEMFSGTYGEPYSSSGARGTSDAPLPWVPSDRDVANLRESVDATKKIADNTRAAAEVASGNAFGDGKTYYAPGVWPPRAATAADYGLPRSYADVPGGPPIIPLRTDGKAGVSYIEPLRFRGGSVPGGAGHGGDWVMFPDSSSGGLWPAFTAAGGDAAGAGGRGGRGRGRWTAASYRDFGGGADFPVHTAGADASTIIGFVKRWWTPVHFAIMGVNELMATLLPAAAAAGAATLVGWQGVEQMVPRIKAINATAESIGGAYGITSGQYLGTGPAIQHYQNLATGGVYELGGSAINLMKMGAGGFGRTGLNTIAMLDRGFADMQINMQNRGTMGLLQSLAGKGTDYLRQFGDIGANFGNIFLGLTPHLPGVGGDYLGAIEGASGAFAGGLDFLNQHHMGDIIGAVMATEAGFRVGRPTVGLAGRGIGGLGKLLGKVPGFGRVGASAEEIAALSEATGVDASLLGGLEGTGLAGMLGDLGMGMGMLGGPEVGALALTAFGISKLNAYQSRAQKQVSGMQSQVAQGGFSAAFTPLAHAIVSTTGLADLAMGTPGIGTPVVDGKHLPGGRVGIGVQAAQTLGNKEVYSQAANQFTTMMGNLISSGPQLQNALEKAGLKGVSMADAFQVAQNSLLDLTHAFGPDGKLNKQALTMLGNTVSALGPMTRSAGGFNAAIAAQQVMGSPAMQNLSTVNQAMDSMTQVMTGGAAGMGALFSLLGGSPVTHKVGGINLQAPPAFKQMAGALTSFTTAAGAGAWNTFAGQNGLISTEQQNLDQLRTYMTLGALPLGGKTGAQGIAAYQLQQMLPLASKSPAALAMLMQQGAQMGLGNYYQGGPGDLKSNYKAFEEALAKAAGSSQQIGEGMNKATIATSQLPRDAAQFTQTLNADVLSRKVAGLATSFQNLVKSGGGDTGAIGSLTSGLMSAYGNNVRAVRAQMQQMLSTSGLSGAQQHKIMLQVDANTAAAQAKINGVHGKPVTINIMTKGAQAAQAAMDRIHGKTVTVTVVVRTIQEVIQSGAMAAAAAGIPSFSLPGGSQNMRLHGQVGMKVPGYGGGDIVPAMLEPGELVVPKHMVAAGMVGHLAGKIPGFQTGGFVGQSTYGSQAYWGMGSRMALWNPALYAQMVAAMNATQPHMPPHISGPVHADAVFAGMATGSAGSFGSAGSKSPGATLTQLNAEIRKAWQTLDKLYAEKDKGGLSGAALANLNAQIKNFWKTVLDPLYAQKDALTGKSGGGSGTSAGGWTAAQLAKVAKEFTVHLGGDIAKEVKGSSAAKNIATALINKLTQEVSYAKSVQSSMKSGLNLGGMDVTPGTGNGTVFEQMQSYAGSLKSFSGDLSKLGRGHLNKTLMKQIVAAGPVQGDALAQSILNDYGGIGNVNKEYAQINKMANKLGIKAAELQYGGHLSDNLRSGTVSSHGININVSLNKGVSGDLELTPEQVAAIVAKVQAALLKQAKKNNKTGIKAHGKGA